MKYSLGFLTKKEKSQLIEIISQSIIKWCEEWISLDVMPDIQLEEYSKAYHELLGLDFYCLNNKNPIVGFLKNDTDVWVNVLFKNINNLVPSDNITELLLEDAKKDLLAKFYTDGDSKEFSDNLIKLSDIDFRGIPVIANIQLDSESFQLLLDSNLLNSEGDVRLSENSVSLKSINQEVILIQTKFKLDKLSVSDFIDIQVGDVIKSNHLISQPFSVFCKDNEIALASLGQAENNRAILLTSNHEIKK